MQNGRVLFVWNARRIGEVFMMNGNEIKLIISDFDGTLVDTFKANYHAYEKAFSDCGFSLTESEYKNAFGFRYDDFMAEKGISDTKMREEIRKKKAVYYPKFFSLLKLNEPLVAFIVNAKKSGVKTVLASTATKKNLMNALNYLKINNLFDVILTGEDTTRGKPNPEIYEKALKVCDCNAKNAFVFEDSAVGCEAARRAGIAYIKIGENWYGN